MGLRLVLADLRELPASTRMAASVWRRSTLGRETLGRLLRRQAERHPQRVLLRFEEETVTYAQFNAGVNAFAAVFAQAGIGREPVALMMENSPALLMAQVAVAKVGAIAALIDTHLTDAPLRHVLLASGARHVYADAACLPHVVDLPESVSLTIWGQGNPRTLPLQVEPLDAALAAASTDEPPSVNIRGSDVFLYMYTSGTTGDPKPAIVRHNGYTVAGIALSSLLGITADDVLYAPLPLHHGESNLIGFSVAVRSGATLTSRRRFSANEFLPDVRRYGATMFVYAGELCRYLMQQPPTPLDREHRLRLAVGAGLRPDIWEAFQQRFGLGRIVEMYGATEGNARLINRAGRVGSVGRPAPFQHRQLQLARYDVERGELVRKANGFLVPVEVGEAGELLSRVTTRGPMPFEGYKDRQASEVRIVRNAFEPEDAYFRTGDLLRRDAAGFYYFVDRIGDMFRWKGENVAPLEVAELLNSAPGVAETNVYGVRLPGTDGRAGMAAVVLKPDTVFDAAAFYAHTRQLPASARPVFVRLLERMDMTATLKRRKLHLQQEGFDPEAIDDPLFVRDDDHACYEPLSADTHASICAGRRRF
jgi:fatty-acyl-CoA synthase